MEANIDDIRLNLPATNKYLNVLGACIDAFVERIPRVEESRIVAYNIQLAVNEIMANIIAHAYGESDVGRIEILVSLLPGPRRMLIELFDTGRAFDPAMAAAPNLEEAQVHGYGLFLVGNLMDDVVYERQGDGNIWRLTKYL